MSITICNHHLPSAWRKIDNILEAEDGVHNSDCLMQNAAQKGHGIYVTLLERNDLTIAVLLMVPANVNCFNISQHCQVQVF